MPLALPTPNEYQQVIQNPGTFLSDPRLKKCWVDNDPMGLPKVRSGGFALTYHLLDRNSKWALRCFHKVVMERESRYAAICRFLALNKSDILIPVEYIQEGVLVKGNWYPVTIMEWVEGDTLNTYLYKNIGNQRLILNLIDELRRLVDIKDQLQIAHGDLSHLNIIIRSGKMVLIDYDGMYVPELSGQNSIELGNSHFQHPWRNERNFDQRLDRFSEIVLYLTLTGLVDRPDLYASYAKGGEGLILTQDDFLSPDKSRVLSELERITNLKALVQQFRQICQNDVNNVPKLIDFIQNRTIRIDAESEREICFVANKRINVLKSTEKSSLLENEGEYVAVVGKVTGVKEGKTRKGSLYVFINFGDWREQCFTAVLWSETLELMHQSGQDPKSYKDQWVSVTGLISNYVNDFGSRPQIILDSPTNIGVITYQEAQQRLSGMVGNSMEVKKKVNGDQPQRIMNVITSGTEQLMERKQSIKPKPSGPNSTALNNSVTSSQKENPLSLKSNISDELNKLYSKPIDSCGNQTPIDKKKIVQKKIKGFLQRVEEVLNKIK